MSHAKTGCLGEPSWSLDGKALIAVCDGAILSIRVADGVTKGLTKDEGIYESPIPSPDGGRIAYLFTEKKRQSYTVRKLWVMNADGSRARVLSGALDRDAAKPQWSSESRTVYFLADDRGATHVYAASHKGLLLVENLRGQLRFLRKHRGLAYAEHARRLMLVALRLRGVLVRGERGRTYREGARWLASGRVADLLT